MARQGEAIRNVRLDDEEFFRIRNEEVLPMWKTGQEIADFDECIAAAKELSAGKNYAERQLAARENEVHNLQPQFGHALTEQLLEGVQYVESESPLLPNGVWNFYTDSYTRKCSFDMAQVGLERTKAEGQTMLNGYPIVNHGVEEARKVKRAVRAPITMNSTDEDGRLASEIALASGWNACNCRSLQEVIAHCKYIDLADEIRINQYESRLAAKYTEAGVPIAPHITSNLTGYDAPGFKALVMTSQTLIGAAQGIKQFYFELGLNMHLIEDCATINVTEKLAREYLDKFGYTDIKFSSGAFPFLGAWPPRIDEAEAMIAWNTVDTFLAGIDTAILKCRDEAFATPTKEGMSNAVRMARHLDTLIGRQHVDTSGADYRLEEQMIELEVRSILDKCLEVADGDAVVALCKGVEAGWIDAMLTPWVHNRGNVRLMRDAEKAQRYWDMGDLPVPQEVRDYHRKKLESRAKIEGRPLDFSMLVGDLQFASRIAPQV
ncbi:hypothetical protein [Gordonibacter massiliensis (ex Traore et al. 2017)]|uniref:Methylaspartate mutase subunit E n=1 Tax=Gordonibacter massiliensis (ex Traore et al. 2017) TaxID=1841863 RepID=A0A842JAV3_9ACTN|nr:hypothetical protein [Gordonibacter massiliensis (ex Traore et al. 2017)]MBC2888983.1 hypothetical protein [Gordonibacter massiliensis (ex Traore et al. 2017)]